MAAPELGELFDRLEGEIGRWDDAAAAAAVLKLAGEHESPAGYAQWTLRRVGQRDFEIRTIAGDVGRGITLADALQDLLARLT